MIKLLGKNERRVDLVRNEEGFYNTVLVSDDINSHAPYNTSKALEPLIRGYMSSFDFFGDEIVKIELSHYDDVDISNLTEVYEMTKYNKLKELLKNTLDDIKLKGKFNPLEFTDDELDYIHWIIDNDPKGELKNTFKKALDNKDPLLKEGYKLFKSNNEFIKKLIDKYREEENKDSIYTDDELEFIKNVKDIFKEMDADSYESFSDAVENDPDSVKLFYRVSKNKDNPLCKNVTPIYDCKNSDEFFNTVINQAKYLGDKDFAKELENLKENNPSFTKCIFNDFKNTFSNDNVKLTEEEELFKNEMGGLIKKYNPDSYEFFNKMVNTSPSLFKSLYKEFKENKTPTGRVMNLLMNDIKESAKKLEEDKSYDTNDYPLSDYMKAYIKEHFFKGSNRLPIYDNFRDVLTIISLNEINTNDIIKCDTDELVLKYHGKEFTIKH